MNAASKSGLASRDIVLEVEGLRTVFHLQSGPIAPVNGVSFELERGEILGLVGESGSGKSVTGLSIMGMIDKPGLVESGSVRLSGRELVGLDEQRMRAMRGHVLSMIFQDPMTTLNPVLTIGRQFYEVLRAHERPGWAEAMARAETALAEVGIPSPRARLSAYPHELSGGMRQRVCIALSLIGNPKVVIADEPTTALDVTIQSQILSVVQNLVRERGVAMVWITHDLSVVAGLCERIIVMYAGRLVEVGPTDEVLSRPAHPYTQGLLASIPDAEAPRGRLKQIPGTQPSPAEIPTGCAFRTRCAYAGSECEAPPELAVVGPKRRARCHFPRTAA